MGRIAVAFDADRKRQVLAGLGGSSARDLLRGGKVIHHEQ